MTAFSMTHGTLTHIGYEQRIDDQMRALYATDWDHPEAWDYPSAIDARFITTDAGAVVRLDELTRIINDIRPLLALTGAEAYDAPQRIRPLLERLLALVEPE